MSGEQETGGIRPLQGCLESRRQEVLDRCRDVWRGGDRMYQTAAGMSGEEETGGVRPLQGCLERRRQGVLDRCRDV